MKLVNAANRHTFEEAVLRPKDPVLVLFYSPRCRDCRAYLPEFERLAGMFYGPVTFAKVNVDEERRLADRFHIINVPTLLLFREGEVVDTVLTGPPAEWMEERLWRLLGPPVLEKAQVAG